MAAGDATTSRLSPIQLARFFQALQGSAEWRREAGIKSAAGVFFGDYYLIVRGELDLARLQSAWCQVAEHEPLLRAGFDGSALSRPVQHVRGAVTAPVQIVDWSGPAEPVRWAEMGGLRAREAARGFDLSEPPLARLTVARAGPGVHWLIMAAHDVILDSWSIGLLFDRLLRCYDGVPAWPCAAAGQHGSYLEYAEGLRQRGIAGAEQFWTGELRGFHHPVRVGDDDTVGGGGLAATRKIMPLQLDGQLRAAVSGCCARSGIAAETVLYAAFALALSRHSGEADVVIGVDVPGRDHQPGLTQMVGPFRNRVPVRVLIDEEETAGELLRRVESQRRAVTEFEYMPEPLIREWGEASLAREWLFAHVVTVVSGAPPLHQPAALAVDAAPMDQPLEIRPLGLNVRPAAGQLDCEVSYCTTLIGDPAAARFGRHLVNIVRSLTADPGTRLRDTSMLASGERTHLAGGPAPAFPQPHRIENLVWQWAQSRPGAPAVRTGDSVLTYGGLMGRATRWAASLREAGVQPGDLAGVHMRRTPELVAALLGIFMAGGAYVPLDPAYPGGRLAAIAADAGLRAVLDDTGCPPASLREGRALLPPPQAAGAIPGGRLAAGDPDALAYVLYTSGSTGRPKGVEVSHRNAVNMLLWAGDVLGEDLQAFLATTSVNFDCSILELFGTLGAGGTVMLAGGPLSASVLRAAAGARIVNGVPSVMAEALRDAELPASVRTVILGGEPPLPALIGRIRDSGPVRRILNLYGPTETTSYSTIAEGGTTLAHPPPIGRPIANTQAYLLDRYQNPVPAGVTGELYIGGAGVARGYHGLPELTREKFARPVVAGTSGGRLYRTGDLVRYSEDGELLFIGRGDSQVKIHGVRVEIGEVEHVLATVEGVSEAVVLAGPGEDGQLSLAAWVTPSAGGCLTAETVRSGLHQMLPSAMVPAAITVTDELPRTPTGKLDREALWALAAGRARPESAAPRTPVERWLADVWAELLGVAQVGIADDFFELGGDSFLAMRMIGRAQEEGFPLEPADIYTAATIASLAALITSRPGSGQPGAVRAGAAP
ncbi:MAG: non-ribosomal peptide synthetase [Streptosporangiaceae bacterium]